ncbi:hypothetical protein XENTR_v10002609 [Xenopus tropicalis]|nr:hypothetical protein XENTR_v10002609 [Xenopus tropicalis]
MLQRKAGMAAVGTPFNGMLYRMDFHKSSDSLHQISNLQSSIDNSFFSADMSKHNPANPASTGSSVNFNNAYFNMYSLCNQSPSSTGGGITPFMPNAIVSPNSGGGLGCSATGSGFPHSSRNKHKREEDIFECPLKKRRISEHAEVPIFPEPTTCHSSADILIGETLGSSWDSNCKSKTTTALQYSDSELLPVMHSAQTEEMEESSSESFSPVCGRAQVNYSRLSSTNDELEMDKTSDHLPSLIMSDVLKEGLKRGFEESLTKKIVDSMNRPSMELVLWKPQSELLFDRLQAVFKSHKKERDLKKPAPSASQTTSFIQEIEIIEDDHLCSSEPTSDLNRTWSRDDEEEEMEL